MNKMIRTAMLVVAAGAVLGVGSGLERWDRLVGQAAWGQVAKTTTAPARHTESGDWNVVRRRGLLVENATAAGGFGGGSAGASTQMELPLKPTVVRIKGLEEQNVESRISVELLSAVIGQLQLVNPTIKFAKGHLSLAEAERNEDNTLTVRIASSMGYDSESNITENPSTIPEYLIAPELLKMARQVQGEMTMAERLAKVKELDERLDSIKNGLQMADRADAELIRQMDKGDELDELKSEVRKLASDERGKKARRDALVEGVDRERAEAAKKSTVDPLVEQLEKLVELRVKEAEQAGTATAAGQASSSTVQPLQAAVTEARIRLIERKMQLGGNGAISDIGKKFLDELKTLSVDLNEIETRRQLVQREIETLETNRYAIRQNIELQRKAAGDIPDLQWKKLMLLIEDVKKE